MAGGFGDIMKQAQRMQEDMQRAQEELANTHVTGEAGGGMVKVTMNCKHEVSQVSIEDQSLFDDKEMIEDLLAAAVNDAVRKVADTTSSKLGGLAGALNLPAGFKLPF